MGQHLVVADPPGLDLGARVIEVDEPVLVQALVPKLPVEGLDENVVDGFARPDEVELDATAVRPRIECGAGKLGAVVNDDRRGSGRLVAKRSRTRVTRRPDSPSSTSMARHSRLASSTMYRSATFWPASAVFKTAMICSSENRLSRARSSPPRRED